jgi:2,3-bisphosphoglycerate-independent phosphoglycerate mutase
MEVSDTFRAILRQHPINAQRIAEGKNPANVVLLRGCGIRIQVSAAP